MQNLPQTRVEQEQYLYSDIIPTIHCSPDLQTSGAGTARPAPSAPLSCS